MSFVSNNDLRIVAMKVGEPTEQSADGLSMAATSVIPSNSKPTSGYAVPDESQKQLHENSEGQAVKQ